VNPLKYSLFQKPELQQSLVFPPNSQQFEKICELEKLLSLKEEIIQKLEAENNSMSLRLTSQQETGLQPNSPYIHKLANESAALKEMNRRLLQEIDRLKEKLAVFEPRYPATGIQNSNIWTSDVDWTNPRFKGSHSSVDN
jgi:predicted nuclease with TOPRIM domain